MTLKITMTKKKILLQLWMTGTYGDFIIPHIVTTFVALYSFMM
jgi:hypothetical protein